MYKLSSMKFKVKRISAEHLLVTVKPTHQWAELGAKSVVFGGLVTYLIRYGIQVHMTYSQKSF